MKCLSLWQPWASLLVHGAKRVETRSWPIKHRGPLLIHSAKTWNPRLRYLTKQQPFKAALMSLGVMWSDLERPDLPFGAVVGRVDVRDCLPTERVGRWENRPGEEPANYVFDNVGLMGPGDGKPYLFVSDEERAFGDYSPGRFVFICKEFEPFDKPIPFPGSRGLFDVPDAAIEEACNA